MNKCFIVTTDVKFIKKIAALKVWIFGNVSHTLVVVAFQKLIRLFYTSRQITDVSLLKRIVIRYGN